MLNATALFIPVLLLLMLFEWYISYKKQDNNYTVGNIAMNLAIGAIDQICSLFYFASLYLVMQYVYTHYRLFENTNAWYQWAVGYIAVDFLSYWYHRFSHRVNILWAGHVTHHSSEHYNFTNGFRTSFFQGLNRIIFWSFLPVFGFSPVILVIILKVSGIYDFLLHTSYIPKLGILEKILITPSLHRVHHGKNDIYIDKNYGSTFLIWDKMFGTYQEETETVTYGIKSPYVDNNPFMAIGHHYYYLWQAMKATDAWTDKIKLLFMPPEWKPRNAAAIEKPVSGNTIPVAPHLKQYAFFQVLCSTAGLIAMLVYKDYLSNWEIFLCSATGIIAMSNSAMIINGNIRSGFTRREAARILTGILLAGVTLFFYRNIYLLPVLFFLLVSLVFTGVRYAEDE